MKRKLLAVAVAAAATIVISILHFAPYVPQQEEETTIHLFPSLKPDYRYYKSQHITNILFLNNFSEIGVNRQIFTAKDIRLSSIEDLMAKARDLETNVVFCCSFQDKAGNTWLRYFITEDSTHYYYEFQEEECRRI